MTNSSLHCLFAVRFALKGPKKEEQYTEFGLDPGWRGAGDVDCIAYRELEVSGLCNQSLGPVIFTDNCQNK